MGNTGLQADSAWNTENWLEKEERAFKPTKAKPPKYYGGATHNFLVIQALITPTPTPSSTALTEPWRSAQRAAHAHVEKGRR